MGSRRRFITSLAGLVLSGFAMVALAGAQAEVVKPAEAAILTVTGKIANANRGPFDAFRDGVFKVQEKSFEKAFAFDRAMLGRLKQVEITANAESFPAPVKLKGPLLEDVLALVKPQGESFAIYALDGYAWQAELGDIKGRGWILALEADGKPLSIGGRGPLWLAYDTGNIKITEQEEAKWVWAVYHIAVK